MSETGTAARWPDLLAAVGLAVVTLAFLSRWPHDLYLFDEGLLLYEAKRILAGDVIYRDFFEIVTPGSFYLTAAALGLFGTSIDTARGLNGAIQAGVVVLVFAAARRAGARRELAVPAALAHLMLATLFLPILSPHWLSTGLTLLALYVALGPPRPRRAIGIGVAVGLLVLVQQHRGAVIAAAGLAVVGLDARAARLAGAAWRAALAPIRGYAAGMLLVGAPVLVALLLAAGIGPVVDALVLFPLRHYHGRYNRPTWGGDHLPVPEIVAAARLAAGLPAIVLVAFGRLLAAGGLGVGGSGLASSGEAPAPSSEPRRSDTRRLAVLAIFSAFSTLSVVYNPNALHLALIAAVQLVLVAETLEWLLGRIRGRAGPAVGWAGAALAVAAIAWQLDWNLRWSRFRHPHAVETAFGHIDVQSPAEVALLTVLQAELAGAPRREILGYPIYASVYLHLDADNPTRFQVLLPGYSPPEHIEEAIAVLEARKVPFVAVYAFWIQWRTDPMIAYLRTHYERVTLPGKLGKLPGYVLFKRKPEAASAAASPARTDRGEGSAAP